MAQRRMFSIKITRTDAFLDMPLSAQALYMHLSLEADDDGFVSSPKSILRLIGCPEDSFKILIAKQFIIPFQSGVCVIRHWLVHNCIQKDRYTPTMCKYERAMLSSDDNKAYNLDTECFQNVSKMEPQVRLGKVSSGKVIKDMSPSAPSSVKKPSRKPSQVKQFTSEFEEWYQGYPKKRGRGEALKSYIKLRKEFTKEELYRARDNYISEMTRKGTEDKYIMMASSFLGPKRQGYLDYLESDNTESNLEAEKSKKECDNMRRILGLEPEPPQGEVVDVEVIPEREALPWR